VLDIGCGFGLFSLYYAATGRQRFLRGIDLDARRIAIARRAAARSPACVMASGPQPPGQARADVAA